MTHWETIRTMNTARFAVALQCTYEESPDSSWYDDQTRDAVSRGVLASYVFRVVVLCDGREVGADYLGDSVYENPGDFAREHIGARGRWGSYFKDMTGNAICEARRALRNPPRVRRCDPAID